MYSLFKLFSKKPPARWARRDEMPLVFNLASESLNGVAIEDPFEKLSVFGRPSNPNPFAVEMFDFRDLGLEIGGVGGRISYFAISIRNYQGTRGEATLVTERGTPLTLSELTRPADVEAVLGKPFEKEIREEEVSYRYRCKRLILLFEFDEDQLLHFEAGLEGEV
jgi:hypothetical protein